MGTEALLAEAISWLLGREIGAPVPDAAFCDDPTRRGARADLLVLNEARHAGTCGELVIRIGSHAAECDDTDNEFHLTDPYCE